MFVRIAAAGLAGVIAAMALTTSAQPAYAKGMKGPVAALKGNHMGSLKGVGPQGNQMIQFKLDVSRGFDGSATGTHRWRVCKGIERLCQRNIAVGGGWSKPTPVSLGVVGAQMFVGQSREGMIFLSVLPGRKLQATFLPHASGSPRADGPQWRPGTFFGILNCLAKC